MNYSALQIIMERDYAAQTTEAVNLVETFPFGVIPEDATTQAGFILSRDTIVAKFKAIADLINARTEVVGRRASATEVHTLLRDNGKWAGILKQANRASVALSDSDAAISAQELVNFVASGRAVDGGSPADVASVQTDLENLVATNLLDSNDIAGLQALLTTTRPLWKSVDANAPLDWAACFQAVAGRHEKTWGSLTVPKYPGQPDPTPPESGNINDLLNSNP